METGLPAYPGERSQVAFGVARRGGRAKINERSLVGGVGSGEIAMPTSGVRTWPTCGGADRLHVHSCPPLEKAQICSAFRLQESAEDVELWRSRYRGSCGVMGE
jgi:hypothetical protein